jgi:hypothetical protein
MSIAVTVETLFHGGAPVARITAESAAQGVAIHFELSPSEIIHLTTALLKAHRECERLRVSGPSVMEVASGGTTITE